MRGVVYVLADLELSEVDPVPQHLADTTRGHAEALRELEDRRPRQEVASRGLQRLRFLVRLKAARLRVLLVASWCLTALPDASLNSARPRPDKPFATFLSFVLGDGSEDISSHAPARG